MTARTSTTWLRVDETRCQGHGRCYSISPELFDCDDEGFGVARPVGIDEANLGVARRIVGECPEQAIEMSGKEQGLD